jgi:hypothetical protein
VSPRGEVVYGNVSPERTNHEEVSEAPTLGAPGAYCSKRHTAMPGTRTLSSSPHRSAQSRGPPATWDPVIIVDAVHVTGPSVTFRRPQETSSAPPAADALRVDD